MAPVEHACPACGRLVAHVPGNVAVCAHCGEQFFVQPPAPPELGIGSPDRLDLARVRRVTALRRARLRSRSHALIAGWLALFLAVQSLWSGARHATTSPGPAAGWIFVGVGLMLGSIWMFRIARRLRRGVSPPVPGGRTEG